MEKNQPKKTEKPTREQKKKVMVKIMKWIQNQKEEANQPEKPQKLKEWA